MRPWGVAMAVVLGALVGAGVAHGLPPGHGWWCIPMAGDRGMCERTAASCLQNERLFPWGGLPPPRCAASPVAYCFELVHAPGAATPLRQHRCYRDAAACASVRATTSPATVRSITACSRAR